MPDMKETFQVMMGEEKPAIPETHISEQTATWMNND